MDIHNSKVLTILFLYFISTLLSQNCFSLGIDTHFLPPSESYSKSLYGATVIEGMPISKLESVPHPIYTHLSSVGKKYYLLEKNNYFKAMRVAEREDLDIDSELIFSETPLEYNGSYFFVGEMIFEEAEGIRLAIDFSKFGENDLLWLYVPGSDSLFGPFPMLNTGKPLTEYWLPTIEGNNVILIAKTRSSSFPLIRVVAYMFYFARLDMLVKSLPCPLSVACVDDGEFQKVSTGIGRLLIRAKEGEILCTGTLINDGFTTHKNYFITANHCFDGYKIYWEDLEVIWDYRCEDCSNEKCPSLNDTLRSEGAESVAMSECLDTYLIRIVNEVPVGQYGRAYAGWDTAEVTEGSVIYGAHHPEGKLMMAVIGKVDRVDVGACRDAFCSAMTYHTNEILWTEGITDFGSSGAGIFCKDFNFKLVGMLSSGPKHNCIDRSNNYDYIASFRYFFPLIKCYLVPNEKCEETADCESGCLMKSLFYPETNTLEFFRFLRDRFFSATELGRKFIKFYYSNSPRWIEELDKQEHLKKQLKQIFSSY
ncbi:MAG: trypsin-like serine protease [Candidatus Hydrogenedentes bacterium]|nr:trypsin-like serine protease [Candidatus Hydrogenedentota bacterium]